MEQDERKTRTHCMRCGECCLGSSPTLHVEDVSLVTEGPIEKSRLYTIREGELVHDPLEDRFIKTPDELIKIKEHDERSGCFFFDPSQKACTIYEHRPVQCRALACWDSTEFMAVYGRPRATRDHFVTDHNLRKLLDEHDVRCSYGELEQEVMRIESEGETAVERILGLLKFDYRLRGMVEERLGVPSGEMDFLLGRPFTETIIMFGLKVVREPDGSFFLTVLEK